MRKSTILAMLLTASASWASDLSLWYDRPASHFEEAFVIGNGRLGATVYCGTDSDRISLNDITLWTGAPDDITPFSDVHTGLGRVREALDREDYRAADSLQLNLQGHYSESYQPLGTIVISYHDRGGHVTGYRRELDISRATASVSYDVDSRNFTTEYFASAPDSVIVIQLKSASGTGISATVSLSSPLPHTFPVSHGVLSMEGYAAYHSQPRSHGGKHFYDPQRGMRFRTSVAVDAPDGTVRYLPEGRVSFDGCSEATLIIANATSFNGFDKDPVTTGRDYRSEVGRHIAQASARTYADLKKAHIDDYSKYFGRVSLQIGSDYTAGRGIPTDRRLLRYTDSAAHDPALEALYFQYGRYLLISSSRTPAVPANLQGLWNEKVLPPWCSGYTTNINMQENYWAAEVTNLSEFHLPLIQFIRNLSINGHTAAHHFYGVTSGWCAGHNTDIWAMACPVGDGTVTPIWANWTMGGAWLISHIWQHYIYTLDSDFLKMYYPVMRGAARFCMDWLVEKDGVLLTSPGTSPENRYVTPDGYAGSTLYGATADLAIIRQCLIDTRLAAMTLHTDSAMTSRIDSVSERLAPYRVGVRGNLQEWYHDWRDHEPTHRHQSHLYGLFPGDHITTEDTPALADACRRTLELRGEETTGWSTGWRINLYARLRDSKMAYRTLRKLLRYISPDEYKGNDARRGGGTYPNLLDAHSPFQIDGNFGGCAGIAEMLMQSTPGTITLLPALPDAWSEGTVKGLCARGGFTIDMSWSDSRVTEVTISSVHGGRTELSLNGRTVSVDLRPGQSMTYR